MQNEPAGGAPLDRGVRPVAEVRDGCLCWHIPDPMYTVPQRLRTGLHFLFDKRAIDDACEEAHTLAREDFDIRAQQRDERDELRARVELLTARSQALLRAIGDMPETAEGSINGLPLNNAYVAMAAALEFDGPNVRTKRGPTA